MVLDYAEQGNERAQRDIDKIPDLWPWLTPIITAFFCLEQSRGYIVGGNGAFPAPLVFSEIVCYHKAFEIDDFTLPVFVRLVQAVDRAWILAKQPKSKAKPPPTPDASAPKSVAIAPRSNAPGLVIPSTHRRR